MTANLQLPWFFTIAVPPDHDPKHQLPNFETAAQAKQRRRQLIRCLRGGENEHRWLARKLRRCREKSPCGSMACPVCQRRYRRWWLAQAAPLLNHSRDQTAVSLIVPHWQRPFGRLHEFDARRFKAAMRARLRRALPDNLVVGGIDISLNVGGLFASRTWAPHVYLIVDDADKETVRAALEGTVKATPEVPRPLQVRAVREPLSALSYAVKPFIGRRCSYVARDGKRATRKTRLKAAEALEAALVMDGMRPQDRLILKGVRLRGGRLVATSGRR